jgi:hypothetical protein
VGGLIEAPYLRFEIYGLLVRLHQISLFSCTNHEESYGVNRVFWLREAGMMDKTHPIAGPDTSKHPFTLICVYESLGMSQPSFEPGQSKKKGGERDEGQEKGHGQASQTAGSKVLGDDAGC